MIGGIREGIDRQCLNFKPNVRDLFYEDGVGLIYQNPCGAMETGRGSDELQFIWKKPIDRLDQCRVPLLVNLSHPAHMSFEVSMCDEVVDDLLHKQGRRPADDLES